MIKGPTRYVQMVVSHVGLSMMFPDTSNNCMVNPGVLFTYAVRSKSEFLVCDGDAKNSRISTNIAVFDVSENID